MERYLFRARNGELIPLHRDEATGDWLCPVCGAWLKVAPYAPSANECLPSREWCPGCETQFGLDDLIPHDAPPGTLAILWEERRDRWLRDHAANDQLAEQLARLNATVRGEV